MADPRVCAHRPSAFVPLLEQAYSDFVGGRSGRGATAAPSRGRQQAPVPDVGDESTSESDDEPPMIRADSRVWRDEFLLGAGTSERSWHQTPTPVPLSPFGLVQRSGTPGSEVDLGKRNLEKLLRGISRSATSSPAPQDDAAGAPSPASSPTPKRSRVGPASWKADVATQLRGVAFPLVRRRERGTDESDLDAALGQCEHATSLLEGALEEVRRADPTTASASCFGGVLKAHQVEGVTWLRALHRCETSGILADEMGLGKTVQISAFLALLADKRAGGPHLVIVPTSLLENWSRELVMWAPNLTVFKYSGPPSDRRNARDMFTPQRLGEGPVDVVLSSYSFVSIPEDCEYLKKWGFDFIIVDEAHMIREPSAQRSFMLNSIPSRARVLLTGTPIQNNMRELWGVLFFLLPQFFPTPERANSVYKQLFTGKDASVEERLKKLLTSFILRRLKSDVAKDMPEKKTEYVHCEMGERQAELYRKMRILLRRERDSLSVCMQLRKMANHPLLHRRVHYSDKQAQEIITTATKSDPLFEGRAPASPLELSDYELHQICCAHDGLKRMAIPDEVIISYSCKTEGLLGVLAKLKRDDYKALVFSEMRKVLDILEPLLVRAGWSVYRVDGRTSMKMRQRTIDGYVAHSGTPLVMLLTTRAMGTGFNVPCTDAVIFFDSSYNPQVDRQAENRAHRLGDSKPSLAIYKMIANRTIDHLILEKTVKKLEMSDRFLNESTVDKKLLDAIVKDHLKASDEAEEASGDSDYY
eukprot:m51a1_g4567 hypothetical protein (757) ;mRNA; f:134218-136790